MVHILKNKEKWGVYVWRMPNGQVVGDDEGNFLSIESHEHDKNKIEALAKAVRGFGVEEGQPMFLPGHRQVSDEEYERQKQRLAEGYIPDELDPANLED